MNSIGITAVMIGGTHHGEVINFREDKDQVQLPQIEKVKLILPERLKNKKYENYKKLTVNKSNQAIYVIEIDGSTANETFVNYFFNSFLTGK